MSQKRSDKQAAKTVLDPPTPFQRQRAMRLQGEERKKWFRAIGETTPFLIDYA